MDLEIEKLLFKGVTEKSCHEKGEVISTVFMVENLMVLIHL